MTNETKSASTAKSETLQTPKQRIALAQTKKAKMIALLSRKSGADVPSLSATLGWRHTRPGRRCRDCVKPVTRSPRSRPETESPRNTGSSGRQKWVRLDGS